MPSHNPHSRLSAIISVPGNRIGFEKPASCHPYSFNLRNQLFHHHVSMPSEYCFVVHWPKLSRLWYCGQWHSLFWGWIHIFCCQYDRHRLLPEHRTRSTSHHHHSSAGSGIHADRILCTSTCFRSTGNMVGCSVGRIVNDSLYYRNLFQRSLHGPPTMSIFATWMHSLKNSATNIKYWKVTYRPY